MYVKRSHSVALEYMRPIDRVIAHSQIITKAFVVNVRSIKSDYSHVKIVTQLLVNCFAN